MSKDVMVTEEESGGKKGDGGKPRWELLYYPFIDEIAKVLTFGAIKYGDENWKKVSRVRYLGAIMRHCAAYLNGERNDKETGLHHLAHAGCCAMFLFWFDTRKAGENE
jgi:hypothetical protein